MLYLNISFLQMGTKVPPPYSWSAAGEQCPNIRRSSSSAGCTVPDNLYIYQMIQLC